MQHSSAFACRLLSMEERFELAMLLVFQPDRTLLRS